MKKDILEEVFNNFLKGPSVFKNRKSLRHDYVPYKLPHREDQIRFLGETLAPALRGSPCSNILTYGKTGTGKTAVMKYVLGKLQKRAETFGSFLKVSFINCRLTGTEYRVLSSICSSLNTYVPFTGLAVGEVFDRFKNCLNSNNIFLLVVLDEIDAIIKAKGDALLYELTRVNENLSNSRVMILGISNDLKFKEYLDPRVLSTLSEEELVFRPYNANELQDILVQRAKLSFNEGVLSHSAIKLCSALAAAEHGDARRAIDLLRVAGELAERRGNNYIDEKHVREAQKRIEHDRIAETYKGLPTHSKLILLSVFFLEKKNSNGSITGDIYNLYTELCNKFGKEPLTQRRVSGLISELDLMGLLNSHVKSLGRYGRTKKTNLGISCSIIKKGFLEDNLFKEMVNYQPKYFRKQNN